MAKGNMLLGHARGKVGSLVFSRANGQQVVRARAEQVKNPQTDAQMVQRILLNTISQAYSKMNAIVDHSFEGIPAGQKSMSYFMKRNLDAIRKVLADTGDLNGNPPYVSPINSNLFALNDYEVAKGSLPDVNPSVMHDDGIYLQPTANTYQAVINLLGLQRGDQVTFLTVTSPDYAHTKFCYSRVILDPRNEDGTEAPLSTAFVTDGVIQKPNPKNEYNGISFKWESQFGTDGITAYGQNSNVAGAIIASRQKEDGTWMRSNSKLVISEDGAIGYSVQEALDDFKSGGMEIINPKYLNNASKSFNNQPASVKHFSVQAAASPAAGGSVSGAGSYEEGATATMQATPNAGYRFARWTENGAAVSTANPYTMTVTRNRSLTAVFQEVQTVLISASASPAAGGSVSGAGNVEQGTSCTLVAHANSGYRFVKWTEGGSDVSTSATYTFTANAARTLVAVFEEGATSTFSNVTIGGQDWSDNTWPVTTSSHIAGQIDPSSPATQIVLQKSASGVPSQYRQQDVVAYGNPSNHAFDMTPNSSLQEGNICYLMAIHGNIDEGYVVDDVYPYTCIGAV